MNRALLELSDAYQDVSGFLKMVKKVCGELPQDYAPKILEKDDFK